MKSSEKLRVNWKMTEFYTPEALRQVLLYHKLCNILCKSRGLYSFVFLKCGNKDTRCHATLYIAGCATFYISQCATLYVSWDFQHYLIFPVLALVCLVVWTNFYFPRMRVHAIYHAGELTKVLASFSYYVLQNGLATCNMKD